MKFFSSKRFSPALILATLFVIYLFNFVTAYSNLVSSRSFGRQIADYALNIAIFTAVIYLIFTLFVWLYSLASGKKVKSK